MSCLSCSTVIMHPVRPLFRGGAACPVSHDDNVPKAQPQLPVVENVTYSRGRVFPTLGRMQGLQEMVQKPPGSMQKVDGKYKFIVIFC